MSSALYADALGQVGSGAMQVPWCITTGEDDVEIGEVGTEAGGCGVDIVDGEAGKPPQLAVFPRIQEAMARRGFPARVFRSALPMSGRPSGSFSLQCALGPNGKRGGNRPKAAGASMAGSGPPTPLTYDHVRGALGSKQGSKAWTGHRAGRHSSSKTDAMLGGFIMLEAASDAAGRGSVVATGGGRDHMNALIEANGLQSLTQFRATR